MKKTIYFLLTLCFFVGGITAQADDTQGTKGWLLTADEINDGGITIFMHVDCSLKQCYIGSGNHTTVYTAGTNDFYVEKVKGGITLKNVETGKYLKSNGAGQTVERVDKDQATVFKAVQVKEESIGNLHANALPAPQSVRIAVADNLSLFLNSSGGSQTQLTSATGTGNWSVFYVYESYHETEKAKWDDTEGAKGTLLTADEINRGGIPVFLHIDCQLKQVYASSGIHTDDYTGDGTNDFFLEKADGGVRLKNVATGDYICGTSGAATRSPENGTVFKALQVTETSINNLAPNAENCQLAVRFSVVDATSTLYLNSSGGSPAQTNFSYAGGNGCWSIFYVYAKALPVSLTETENLDNTATFSAEWRTEAPEGINTYKITETTSDEATLQKTNGSIIPKNEGVILSSESETSTYLYYTSARGGEDDYAGNLLVGLPDGGKPKTEDGTAYVFTKNGENAIFKLFDENGSDFAKNKAYLWLAGSSSETRALAISLDGTATGIDSVASATDNDAPKYDLFGRRVTNVAKGSLYIQGGKKYIAR